ncbi:dead deah box helicase domain-containing protein [Cystoisospora suis]|uniref:ATP-dependent RNA helicase n=1 Tax=Cystoisospora suis TaxID=483139 RepID=A0A2C6L7X2_9APIC|nr:dead deah box helicase domain-containing protein [Cystoisospora suis]
MKKRKESKEKSRNMAVREESPTGQVKQVRKKTKQNRTAEGVATPAGVCAPSAMCAASSNHGNRPGHDVSSGRAKTSPTTLNGEHCRRKKINAQPSSPGGAEQKLSSKFSSMSCLSPLTCGFLRSVHFQYATPVQEACLPLLSPRFNLPGVHTPQSNQHSSSSHLAGRHPLFSSGQNFSSSLKHHDVAVEAPTGSGKTLAFVLPLIERIMNCLNLYEKGIYRRSPRDNADGKNGLSCHFVWDLEKKNRQQKTTTPGNPQNAECNKTSRRNADHMECTYTSHAASRGLSHTDETSSPSEKQDIASQYRHFVSSITEDLSSNHAGENDGRTCRFGGIIIAPTRELARQIFTVVQQCIRSIESTLLLPLPDDKIISLHSSSPGDIGKKKKRRKRRRHQKEGEGLPQPLCTVSNGGDDKEEEDDEGDQDEKEDEEDSNEFHGKKPRLDQKAEDHPRTENTHPDAQTHQSSSSSSSFPSPSSSSFVLKAMLLCGGGRPVEADRLSLWSRRSSRALFLLVATPGRLLRLIESEGEEGKIEGDDLLISSQKRKLPWSFTNLSLLVVDEADRLMDEQHSEDLKKLLTYIREEKKRAVYQLQLQKKMEMKDDNCDLSSETKKEDKEKLSSESNLSSSWIEERIQIAIFSATLAGTVEEQQRSKALWGILKDPICIRVSNSSTSHVPSSSSPLTNGEREQGGEKGQARESEAQSQQLASSSSSSSSYQRHTVPSTLQNFYTICQYEEKLPFLLKFIQSVIIPRQAHCIVFLLTCHCVEFYFCLLSALLCNSSSYLRASASSTSSKEKDSCFPLELEKLHGKMKQRARLAACKRFGSSQGKGSLLLATDVAARGLDFPNVDCILQLDPPQDPNVFIHRIGRTARAGRSGSSLLLLLPHEDAYIPFLTNRGVTMQDFSKSEWVETLENCQLEKEEEEEKHTTAPETCTDGAKREKENGILPHTQGGRWIVRPLNTKKDLEKETEVSGMDEEEEGRLKVLRYSERDMVNTSALNEILQDRNLVLKGTKAFVSFVRAYKEHLLSFLLPFSKLDLGRVATSMYLLRLPRMKEIVGKNFSNFKQHAIDPLTVPFRHDAAREEERLETLQASLEQRAKLREEREKKKNEEKKRMEKQNSLYSKSTMKNSGRTKAEKRKARRQNALDEWEELAFEERMARKLRKGRITEEQYEKQLKQGRHGGGRDEGEDLSDSEDEKGSLSCSSDSDEEGSTAVSSNGKGGMDVESDDGDSSDCASDGESSTGLDDEDEDETERPSRKKADSPVGDEGTHDRKKRKQPKWISVKGRKGKKKRRGKKRR